MNIENLEFLKNQVTYSGFGDISERNLVENIISGKKEFTLDYNKEFFGGKEASATLNFRKSDTQDRYFFNSYDLTIKNKGEDPKTHRFRVELGNTYTLREAYNMMDGRFVHKEHTGKDKEKYQAWSYIDATDKDNQGNGKIKKIGERYGFDFDKLLKEYPIKALNNELELANLKSSLEKGNRQSTIFIDSGGKETTRYIEVDARYKKLNVYDENQQPMKMSQKGSLEENLVAAAKQVEKKNQGIDSESSPSGEEEKKSVRRRRGQTV